ncbi:MAG TPA: hypothetical protein VNX25_06715 [Verrucomicrobiae bacterium]|nr:hypothetical protein [Verrucomicrobiae bacterium]
MASRYEFRRLRRTLVINTVVQIFLVVLLLFAAVKFQQALTAEGRPHRFLHSIVVALVIQVAAFYPLKKMAGSDVRREVEASEEGITPEKLQELRRWRIFSEMLKGAGFLFFITFIAKAPSDRFIQGSILFTFLLTTLTYFQCYGFLLRREFRQKS